MPQAGADLIFVWGGDGTVQRVVDTVAGSDVTLAILPTGTGNLPANNLGIPIDLEGALEVALHGARQDLDVGVINGERFAVMAGAGFDAIMMKDAGTKMKNRFGRLAYVYTGVKASAEGSTKVKVDVDGQRWFSGRAGCVLFGSMGTLTGGLQAFPDADPTDGKLEVGVVTADSPVKWARVLARAAMKKADRSPLARTTRARRWTCASPRPSLISSMAAPGRRQEAEGAGATGRGPLRRSAGFRRVGGASGVGGAGAVSTASLVPEPGDFRERTPGRRCAAPAVAG